MSAFSVSMRPDNWYSMSYEEQRTWDRAERQHRDELDDVERRERQARDDAEREHSRLDAARREHRAYVSELYEENERLSEELAETRTQRDELLAALVLAQKWLANCVPIVELDGPKPLPVIAAAIAKAEAHR